MIRNNFRLLLFLMHSQVQFSATLLKWSIWYKLCTYIHTHFICNPHTHAFQSILQLLMLNLRFYFKILLKIYGGQEFVKGGECPPLNEALSVLYDICITSHLLSKLWRYTHSYTVWYHLTKNTSNKCFSKMYNK